MSYSRSHTQELARSRRKRRLRRLLALNIIMLALIAGMLRLLANGADHAGRAEAAAPTDSAGLPSSAASSAASDAAPPAASSAASPAVSPSTAKAGTAAEPATAPEQVSMAFVGDILTSGRVGSLMKQYGYDYPYRRTVNLLRPADITAGNLETAITNRGTAEKNKEYLYRSPAATLPAIRKVGFDVLTLANNHTLDYGWVGLQDTRKALDQNGLLHVGSGKDDREAYTPVIIERKGVKVAYLGVTRVVPYVSWKAGPRNPGLAEAYNPARAVKAIKEAKAKADLVVVMVHWGVMRTDRPAAHQKDLGHRFIDAGADLVIGSHPHVLQGFEFYKGKWIAYSLGNFIFSDSTTPESSQSGVLTAACSKNGNCSLKLFPMIVKNVQPTPMDRVAGKALLARISAVSIAARLEENGNIVAKR